MSTTEREAMFFAVLRERVVALPPDDRRLDRADEEISAWLDEAEEEGERILAEARAEAASVRALHSDVGALQARLAALAEQVDRLLPAVEAATDSLAALPAGGKPTALRRILFTKRGEGGRRTRGAAG